MSDQGKTYTEDLNKKRDEYAKASIDIRLNDGPYGFVVGFDCCADILLPEIERLNSEVSHQGRMSVKYTEKITQLEKENQLLTDRMNSNQKTITRLSSENDLAATVIEKANKVIEEQNQYVITLTQQLAIATEALESILGKHDYNINKEHWKTKADEALAKIKDVK